MKNNNINYIHHNIRLTRMLTVQILYSWFICAPKELFEDFLLRKVENVNFLDEQELNSNDQLNLDYQLLAFLGQGVDKYYNETTVFIRSFFTRDLNFENLELTLKIILFLAVYEIKQRSEISIKSIINEYVSLASKFHGKKDVGFVNAILDKIAKTLKGDEFIQPTNPLVSQL